MKEHCKILLNDEGEKYLRKRLKMYADKNLLRLKATDTMGTTGERCVGRREFSGVVDTAYRSLHQTIFNTEINTKAKRHYRVTTIPNARRCNHGVLRFIFLFFYFFYLIVLVLEYPCSSVYCVALRCVTLCHVASRPPRNRTSLNLNKSLSSYSIIISTSSSSSSSSSSS